MLANLISQYSSHQHSVSQPDSVARNTGSHIEHTNSDYQPSERALLLTAIAQDIDVTELTDESSKRLRDSLTVAGLSSSVMESQLMNQICLEAKSKGKLNALEFIGQIQDSQLTYQEEKAANHLKATLENLACAYN